MMIFMEMGNHWKITFARCGLLVYSTGIIDVLILMRNYYRNLLCAQQERILGAPWKINDVHIVVGVNNIPNIRPAVIYMPLKSTLPHEFDVWFLQGRLE